MKKILLVLIFTIELFGAMFQAPLATLENNASRATIQIAVDDMQIQVGVSGFLVREISQGHNAIIKKLVVSDVDKKKGIVTVDLSEYTDLQNDALPQIKQIAKVGDMAFLAFGYSRALLIAPSENIYFKIKKNIKVQWIHPDIFATTLSVNGHPTPLQEDFKEFAVSSSVGLVFFYIEKKLYTIDALSFKILNISDAPLELKNMQLPFYSRVKEIDANWFGNGKEELTQYAPHYYALLVKKNKKNKKLLHILQLQGNKYSDLVEQFEIKG